MSTVGAPASDQISAGQFVHGHHSDDRTHVVQFYADDGFLLDELSRFVGTALGAGDAAVVIATKAHREGLAHRLQARGFDVRTASSLGRYVALDAAETLARFTVDGWPDETRFTELMGGVIRRVELASGDGSRIVAFGEMVALLWVEGKPEAAICLEQLWNKLVQSHSFSLHCAYPMSSFYLQEHGDLLLKVCAEHTGVVPDESYTALTSEDERLRSVAHLQHKARALETEIAQREQVEEQLRRNQVELESLVEHRTAALQQLSSRLLSLQDSERRRVARDLHESLGQYLVALKLNVDMLRQSPGRGELWSQAEDLLDRCIGEIRTISYLLHPPTMDAVGLTSAVRWYVEGFARRSGIKVTLDAPDDPVRLPDTIELALFRVLQEALTNVHRHSGAAAADIVIRRSASEIVMEVKDNGRGIEQEMLDLLRDRTWTGVGIISMRERARELGGVFALESDSTGTAVRVTIPAPAACMVSV